MLEFMRCRIINSKEIPVASGELISDEGLALVSTLEGGVEKVKPSANGASEVFCGFSYGYTMTPVTKSVVEPAVVPASAPYTVSLSKGAALIGGQIAIRDVTANAQLDAGDPAANAGEYSVAAGVVTFNAAEKGHTIAITYRYSPTASELMAENRMNIYTQLPTEVLPQIGVILEGEVFTSQFDAAVDWAAGGVIRIGNGGVVTTAGASAAIPGAVLINVPSAEIPYVGIRFGK